MTLRDQPLWAQQILEHRRALFERVIAAFPHIIKLQPSKVDFWRLRLKP
jgi:hypothetical protein